LTKILIRQKVNCGMCQTFFSMNKRQLPKWKQTRSKKQLPELTMSISIFSYV